MTPAPDAWISGPTAAMRSPSISRSPARIPASSTSVPPLINSTVASRQAGAGTRSFVELLDHAVPHRDQIPQIAPEGLRPSAFEVLEGDALLLHPREVPEVEDPISVEFGELQKMVVRRLEDVSGERPLRGSLVEPCRVVSGE